jgi:glycolate oxidase FAD binding subunit
MTTPSDLLLDRLRAVTGDGGTELGVIEPIALFPLVSVTPTTPEQLAAYLSVADDAGAAVVPLGGGTQQRIGHAPAAADVALCTVRLDAIVEWEPADLTACIQAGANLSSVQSALAAHGQQLAIDAPAAGRATLGGLLATNVSGPRRWLYGGWRDQVIGMQMALPSGDLIKSGGRVVKNVQGYDLAKLFIGSLGTLGVVTQVNVKLSPLPSFRRLLVARGDLGSAAGLLEEIAGSTLRASTLDLLDEASAHRCGVAGGGYAAFILLEGSRTALNGQSSRLGHMAAVASMSVEVVEGEALDPIWDAWIALARSDGLGDGEALMTVSGKPSDTLDAVRAISSAAESNSADAVCWAHAGNGLIYALLSAPRERAAAAFAVVQARLMKRWPATFVIGGSAAIQGAVQPWGAEPAAIDLMRALKRRFDPKGTLQPGRFVGGL